MSYPAREQPALSMSTQSLTVYQTSTQQQATDVAHNKNTVLGITTQGAMQDMVI